MNDGFQMKFLSCQARESLVHIEAHLMSEYTDCTGSGAVAFSMPSVNTRLSKSKYCFMVYLLKASPKVAKVLGRIKNKNQKLKGTIYRKGVSRFPTQPTNFFQPERFFHTSGVSKVLFCLSFSNMLFS